MADVDIKKLSKSYDHKTQVLRDIDVSIQSGEFIVLVGPSGCGKSTLLRTIAGLEDITSGEISIAGRVVNHLPPADRNIAMVFQDYALYPHMTVRQNLAFGLKVRKTPRAEIEKQIGVAADILGLQPLLDRKPSALSGGQRQRVAIGRAIVRKPDVFLFDEPLSNLDAQLRMRTRVEIAALHRRLGATTIYVTHDQTEAMTLADKIVLLNRGVVQQMGAPMDLYLRPCNKFVASFLGSPGMNFIDGHFDGPTGFASEGFRLPDATAVTSGPVALGIRPEDVCLATNGQQADVQLPALVVEPLGYETLIAFETPSGDPLLLRTLSAEMPKVRAGDTLPVRFKREAIQWFASTGDGERLG